MDLIIETYRGGDTLFHVDKKGLYESFIFFASPCPEAGVIKCSGILSCEHSVGKWGGEGLRPPTPAVLSRASLLQSIGVFFFETLHAIIVYGGVFKVLDESE